MLIGKKVYIELDEEDMRQVKVYFENGTELGYLIAEGKWAKTKHSLKTRKAINSLASRKILALSRIDDPVVTYMTYLSKKNRSKPIGEDSFIAPKSALEAQRLSKESNIPLSFSSQASESPKPKVGQIEQKYRSQDSVKERRNIVSGTTLDLNEIVNGKQR